MRARARFSSSFRGWPDAPDGRPSRSSVRLAIPVVAAAVAAASVLPATASAAPAAFAAPSVVGGAGPRWPFGLTAGDLDGDGRTDLATADLDSDSVSALLQDASGGTFTRSPAIGIGAGKRPVSIATGDLNGDGRADLVTADLVTDSVSVLLQDGRPGTFRPGPVVGTGAGTEPRGVAVGDVDGDGRADVVTANQSGDSVSVLLQDPTGDGFTRLPAIATVANGLPGSVVVRDLNGDGRADIVVTNYNARSVSILVQDASGAFVRAPDVSTGNGPYSVDVGDLDGDGRPDLVTANVLANSVSVLTQGASGGFTRSSDVAVDDRPRSVAIGDLNVDGRPDLVTANGDGGSVSVLTQDASGRFVRAPDIAAPDQPQSIVVGNLDDDARPDLGLASRGGPGGIVSVLRNTTDVPTPSVSVSSPVDGARYGVGDRVPADYACTDETGGAGVSSCVGPVADGSPIDTATPGAKRFAVTATNAAGRRVTRTVTYTVVGPPPPAPPSGTTPPGTTTTATPPVPSPSTPAVASLPSVEPVPSVSVGRVRSVDGGRSVRVPVTVSGPGSVSAVATHGKVRRAGERVSTSLEAGPGRFTYARSIGVRAKRQGGVTLRLRRTAAGRRARFVSRTIRVRITVRYRDVRGRKAVARIRSQRIRVPRGR